MDTLTAVAADGLVILFNGVVALLGTIAGPTAWLSLIAIVSLAWLAAVEIDELDRMSRKPTVGRH